MTHDRMLRGIGVSPGIALGPAAVVHWDLPPVQRRAVAPDEVEQEIARLSKAIRAVRSLLESLRDRTRERAGPEEAKIFDAQILMLEDPEFAREVENLIRENQLTAERAFEFKTLETRALWAQSPSAQLRERTADLSGILVRVLNQLAGRPVELALHGTDGRPAVVFVRELAPGLTVQFEKEHVAGFASEEGTRTAHGAILARSMGIPCVMGLVGGLERIENGREVLLDGKQGTVILDPTPEEVAEAREGEQLRVALGQELEAVGRQPAVTLDGTAIALRGNLDLPDDLDNALDHGAEGVGLLRTEFLILGRPELPGEDEQASFFRRIGERFAGHPVVVRSYDLGGDKFPPAFRPPPEANPFLGWRAIRVCLDHPEILRTQVRALLRARAHGDVQLMLPLVTQVEEVERSREIVAQAIDDLQREGTEAATELPVGVMIETPAAVMLADQLAERSDFLSVGTNDLTQYTLAVDRGNARLAGRFTSLHPSVIRMLRRIVDAGGAAGLRPSVCGEMASEPLSAFLLLGLGYRVLSVAPNSLPLVRWLVRQVDLEGAERAAREAHDAATAAAAAAILQRELGRFVDIDVAGAGRLPGHSGGATLNTR